MVLQELISERGDFKASILTGSVGALPVYHPVTFGNKSAEGYVESVVGDSYRIAITVPQFSGSDDFPFFQARFYIDGQLVGNRRSEIGRNRLVKEGVNVDEGVRPFVFSKVVLTEEDVPLPAAAHALGTIQIQVVRLALYKEDPRGGNRPRFGPGPIAVGKIAEKGKKAHLAALTSFGAPVYDRNHPYPRPPNPNKPYLGAYVHPDDEIHPFYTMTFRYMPLDLLQAYGIVPRQPGRDSGFVRGMTAEVDQAQRFQQGEDLMQLADLANRPVVSLQEHNARILAKMAERLQARAAEDGGFVDLENDERYADDGEGDEARMERRLREAEERDGGVVDLVSDDEDE